MASFCYLYHLLVPGSQFCRLIYNFAVLNKPLYSFLIFSKLRYNLFFPDLTVLKKFQDDFKRFIVTGGRLSDDEAFKRKNGFTLSDFLQTRRNCAQSLRRIADHIETVTRNTGIAKTTSGLAVIGGILALPFTGGGSLAAFVGGVTGWVTCYYMPSLKH